MTDGTTVHAVNALTARWAAAALDGGTGGVVSGACLWPLPAFPGGAADGPARTELAATQPAARTSPLDPWPGGR
ncbi:hypothetical protein [Streptomyces sp. NPDC020917]|uniref:hypothetical protein n=1 Tax=Streptomyces sp. NPDC020917 TaxID=3365102 RepID=UPI003797184A